jgi:hypothetical protein
VVGSTCSHTASPSAVLAGASDCLRQWSSARPPNQLAGLHTAKAADHLVFSDWRFGTFSAADMDVAVSRPGIWYAVFLTPFGTAFCSHCRFPEAASLLPSAALQQWQADRAAMRPSQLRFSLPWPLQIRVDGTAGPFPAVPLSTIPDAVFDTITWAAGTATQAEVRLWHLWNYDCCIRQQQQDTRTLSLLRMPAEYVCLSADLHARVTAAEMAAGVDSHHCLNPMADDASAAIFAEPALARSVAADRGVSITAATAVTIGTRVRALMYPTADAVVRELAAPTTIHQLRHAILGFAHDATSGTVRGLAPHSMDPVAMAALIPPRSDDSPPLIDIDATTSAAGSDIDLVAAALATATPAVKPRWRVIYEGLMSFHAVCGCITAVGCFFHRIAMEVVDCRLWFERGPPTLARKDWSRPYPPHQVARAQAEINNQLGLDTIRVADELRAAAILDTFMLPRYRATPTADALAAAARGDLTAVAQWAAAEAVRVVTACFENNTFETARWPQAFAAVMEVKSWRFIFNGIPLNEWLYTPSFRYPSIHDFLRTLKPGSYMCALDVVSGFSGIVMALASLPYLCFRGPDGKVYQWLRLPFGLSTGPFIFCCFSALVTLIFRSRGIPAMLVFVDDFLLHAETKAALDSALEVVKEIAAVIGVEFNTEKLQPPSTSMIALGVLVDTVTMRIGIPADKLCLQAVMLSCVQELLRRKLPVPLQLLRRITGKLRWCCQLTTNAYASMGPLWSGITWCESRGVNWLPAAAAGGIGASVDFWLHRRHAHAVGLLRPLATSALRWDQCAASDASGVAGFGAIYKHQCIYGLFNKHWREAKSSTHLELYAMMCTIVHFMPHIAGHAYIHQTDNAGLVAVVAKSSPVPELATMSKAINDYLEQHQADVVPFFQPREQNQLADSLSGCLTFEHAARALSLYRDPVLHKCSEHPCPGLELLPAPKFRWKGGKIEVLHRCNSACAESCGRANYDHPVPPSLL